MVNAEINDASTQVRGALIFAVIAVQAASFQRYYEPGYDLAKLDDDWSTDELKHPVSMYHQISRAFLEGIGDLLTGLILALQTGQPLLASTASLARPVYEYSSRAVFLTDRQLGVKERLGRAAALINEGFDRTGAKSPTASDIITSMSAPFYRWYGKASERWTDRPKKRKYAPSPEILAETLGAAYRTSTYSVLSDYTHGNGPALLGLAQAALRPEIDGPATNAVAALGWAVHAVECAVVATRSVSHFTDPADRRPISELVPYRSDAAEMHHLDVADLLKITESQRKIAQGRVQHCADRVDLRKEPHARYD